MSLSIVILAAGQGKRMNSQFPKVLHKLGGKTLLEHVVSASSKLNSTEPPIVIYGHQGDQVKHMLAHLNVKWIEQTHQLGTGHALQQALPHIPDHHAVLVLYGDVPLIKADTLKSLISNTPKEEAIGILTAYCSDPTGLGRIIRDEQNHILRIIEEKDANEEERAIKEINSGIYFIPARYLKKWLPVLNNQNTQQEYYLTDIFSIAKKENIFIHNEMPKQYEEVLGINDRIQLSTLERAYQCNAAKTLMHQGVTLLDPHRFDLRGHLSVGLDVVIDINVIIEGNVTIGDRCNIGPNTLLRNVTIGNDVTIYANSIIDGAEIASHCVIGPFARVRPGTQVGQYVHLGNFV
ncbi:MAG: bifunctional UDP-N-acetylglucosamine diphosphorylase/glucosamine-1-phosphate N-acetyltransferase GlmU, partial [Gammaproteobacteria bacterium]|nr:bifunctional UDP-N-acetylglucosamine diphosphorylase/glucosamine-1-phosphate N-acetyltransferase GlmU [Gammaproteobacteria bacterium]